VAFASITSRQRSRGVHENREVSDRGLRRFDGLGDLRGVGDIRRERGAGDSSLTQVTLGRAEPLCPPRHDRDVRASLAQCPGDLEANAARPAGDERRLTSEAKQLFEQAFGHGGRAS